MNTTCNSIFIQCYWYGSKISGYFFQHCIFILILLLWNKVSNKTQNNIPKEKKSEKSAYYSKILCLHTVEIGGIIVALKAMCSHTVGLNY